MLRRLTATTASLGSETDNEKSSGKLRVYESRSYGYSAAAETAQIDFEIVCTSLNRSAVLSKLIKNTIVVSVVLAACSNGCLVLYRKKRRQSIG